MAIEKDLTAKEIEGRIVDLKIELLRSPMKKGNIKREIARLLTMGRDNRELKIEDKDTGKTRTKLEDKK
jgi:ribosomal protein L29